MTESPIHNVASTSQLGQEEEPCLSRDGRLRVTLLSSEWKSSKGGLSTINRELAIQLAKHHNVEVSVYLPQCSEEDRKVASSHNVQLIEAEELPGLEPIYWLSCLPKDHHPHCVIGHGVPLGRQVPLIKRQHDCKWIQVVHTAPEELGMFKSYEEAISKGEQKHQAEVKLCERADQVVAVGPKLKDAYSRYLRYCGKDQDVLNLTPGIFSEFCSIKQASEENSKFSILVFGRGDNEDFKLKGYDIAAKAVAELKDSSYQLVFVGAPAGKEDEVAERLLQQGIPASQLRVRRFNESREELAHLLCEVDLAIMPSRTEGFGLTALEALSAGLPVLVSGNSGLGDALKNVSTGRYHVVDSEEPLEWAKAIRIVRQKGREVRLEDAKILREKYAVKYNWQKQCDCVVEKMMELTFGSLATGHSSTAESSNPLLSHVPSGRFEEPTDLSVSQKDKIRHDIEQLNEKLNTFIAQREGSSSKDKDETRDDLKLMKSEIQKISEKLNSQMSQREETTKEENAKSNLKQIKDEIRNINEKLDTLMNQLPPVIKKSGIEDAFNPVELIDGIRQLYKTQEGWLAPFPWCEEFHFHLENIYTRLKVISRKKERGTATDNTVDMSEIFKPHEECSQPRTVLIEGTPGMGKTTYCKKLVYDWATGKQEAEDGFPKFKIVLLLRCRDMKSADLWEAIDDQLLPLDVKEDERERFFDFIRKNQSNVLLILDGLDEVPANKLPMFSEILKGRVLPKCRLVSTARHEAGVKVRIHCDTLLEIEGFTEQDAQNFIVKYFKTNEDLAQKLLDELWYDKNLKMLAKNPLNTALLCLFYEDCQGTFPENRGQLFQEVVQCILRRYRKKEGFPETEDDLLKVYKAQLEHLGWIAFEGLRKDSLDFEESKLANHFVLCRFGFLSVQPGGSKLRPCRHYSFLHKSFQEWFATFYVCCQLVEGKISPDKLLNKLDFDEGDHDVDKEVFLEVLHFAFYMLAARCEELAVTLIQSMAKRVKDLPSLSQGWFYLAMSCIEEFEGDNRSFYVKLTHAFGSSLKCRSLDISYHDIVDIAFLAEVLKVNTTVNNMDLGTEFFYSEDASCIANALKQNSALTRLSFYGCYTEENGAAHLADALKVNTTLTELRLCYNGIGDEGAACFAEALKVNKTLTKLDLDGTNEGFDDDRGDKIGDNGAAYIADALQVNTTLTELSLSCNDIADEGAACFAKALTVNKTLTMLKLFLCDIGEDGAVDLADALKTNATLTELNLSAQNNRIGDRSAARFAEALRVNKTLTKLDLHSCGINVDGGAGLADALKVNATLTELNLTYNGIGDRGAVRFAEALRVNKTLTKLDFSYCDIGKDGGTNLADALKVNTTLTELNLSNNRSEDRGGARFAEALRVNKTLTKLDFSYCYIGKDGGTDLADALKVNKSVTELDLSHNSIEDRGAACFSEALIVNKTLTKLNLEDNGIGNSGTICLADALKTNTCLIELNLSGNYIDMDGFVSLVDAFKHNTTLAKLDLSSWGYLPLNPAEFPDPRYKAVVTELLRLKRDGRVIGLFILE